jgi:hypothetical protein
MLRRLLTLAALATFVFSLPAFLANGSAAPFRDSLAEGNPILGSHQKKGSRAEREEVDFRITGEAARGKVFTQDIGHGLMFQLVPPSNAPDTGWVIEIVPKEQPDDGPIEFSAIATPPYHVYNDRIIATAYGRTAHEVVDLKDRTFFFVRSAKDEHRAEEVVNAAFYPTDLSDEERVRVASEQHEIQVCEGELHILKSHTTHSTYFGGAGNIDWIRFELDVQFSPGLTMANIIARVARPQ